MIQNAAGIILRTHPLTDTSLIVNWLTPEFGRISTAAKGARQGKSTFRGKLDLFYEADFSFVRSRRSDLHTLREISLRTTHAALRAEMNYLQQASYCAALVEQSTEKETPLPAIYELLRDFLAALPKHPPQPRTVFAFELKLLDELGLSPDLFSIGLTARTRELLRGLHENDWPDLSRLTASGAEVKELRQFLHGFLIFHLGKIPRQRAAAIHS